MKQNYFRTVVAVMALGMLAFGAQAAPKDAVAASRTLKLSKNVSVVPRHQAASQQGMVITDFENQVKGRYSVEYYSPLTNPETGQPFGNCIEQPMIVEDYFAEQEGDVNVGYLFFLNAILKGHVDFEDGTISIPSRFATVYYEDPDDLNDPGLDVYFCTVDIEGNRYVPNFDRPFVGTFQLHDGKITKITTDDRWGYVALNGNEEVVGWFEIAENSNFYLGHGEMEYVTGHDYDGDGENDVEQTVVYATSNGNTATVYNAFRTGWSNPIQMEINASALTATVRNQNVTFGGTEGALTDGSGQTVFSGTVRDINWDDDKRDDVTKGAVVFPAVNIASEGSNLASFSNVRFYFKSDVTDVPVGITDITAGDSATDAPAVYYNLMGERMPQGSLQPGIYLQRRGNHTTKVLVK